MNQLPVKTVETSCQTTSSIVSCLQQNLIEYFETSNVEMVECPNLSKAPFNFPIESISKGAVLDIGGPQFLTPTPTLSKKYSMVQILDLCNILHVPNDALLGPCAGPFWEVGTNCEMVACKKNCEEKSDSFIGWVDPKTSEACFKQHRSNYFGILGNFFVCSDQEASKVIHIKAKRRKTDTNFPNAIRAAISKSFPEEVISLGGVFNVSNSKINCHVMPDFSEAPLCTCDDVNDWLNFYAFESPMTFASVVHCHDPGLSLRMEHSHGYNEETEKLGHYHYDLDPETVEYEAVFALASKVVRIDMPQLN